MKTVGGLGPFNNIAKGQDRWICDGVEIPYSVIAADAEVLEADPPAVLAPVPESVSPRQIRQALTRAGLREAVESAVAAGDQDLKDWWEFSTTFERRHSQVEVMSAALGKTSAEVDDVFRLAASL